MSFYKQILCLHGAVLAVLLAGCGSPSGVRITEGTTQPQPGTPVVAQQTHSSPASSQAPAVIVHIDLFERIATIRNGHSEEHTFLIAVNSNGSESGVLKVRASNLSARLRAADILEGAPQVNHTVRPASSSRSEALAKLYPDPSTAN